MNFAYMVALLFSLASMVLIDYRYQLAMFQSLRRTVITLAVGVAVFIVWDVLGIALGIFFSGQSPYMSGWYIAPEFPVEELLFLTFLCYFTLILYTYGVKRWPRT